MWPPLHGTIMHLPELRPCQEQTTCQHILNESEQEVSNLVGPPLRQYGLQAIIMKFS